MGDADIFEKDGLGDSIAELQQVLGTNAGEEVVENETNEIKKETSVRVTPDRHEGWLYLARPEEGKQYIKEEILLLLESYGIKAGLIMSNILAMIKKGVYERSIKVALYKECVEGKGGYYEYFFDTDALENKTPKIKEDGSVDYTSVNLLIGVEKDQKICKYHPAVEGEEGFLIDGTPLVPAKVADLPTLKGKGFRFNPDTNEYFSELDGKLDFTDKYDIQIKGVYELKGDVTQLNPRIEFNGDIEIDGNVESGTVIRSTRSVSISGVVEAAEIYAGGDIVLKRGIQGSNKAKVVCNGSVYADFIEHTMVKAKGDVNSNTILNSEVLADGVVTLTGKRGTVVGGYVHGRKGISCVNLGNGVEVKTVAHVGLETKDYLKNQEIMKKDVSIRERLQEILERMTYIAAQRKIRQITKPEIDELNALNEEKNRLVEDLKFNQKEQEQINKIVEEARGAEIRVEDHVYKGAIIAVDASRMPILADTKYMIYKNENGIIEGSVIVMN